ncbi:probable indole-3-pyruvate monooxygenase YUCCA10 [Rosa rugosa]|uniref:probable indole-3-pyruvate monooxygenase YUCCA10 n=1 Tax=Rosa rugosa TaxID=74645 RepID=UPI002B40D5CD|nr:probable indole-3-pyruvate monooxygenase YUCCA10 [Rosa rugosa]
MTLITLLKKRASGGLKDHLTIQYILLYCVPDIEGLSSFDGDVLQSTIFKSGVDFKNNNVLVVVSGNSGMEIALDLANDGAKTSIIVQSPVTNKDLK